jgi:hypothetical protein
VLSIHLDIGDIVLKDGWDVDLYDDFVSLSSSSRAYSRCINLITYGRNGGIRESHLTSGKVPFEKTLSSISFLRVSTSRGILTSTDRFYHTINVKHVSKALSRWDL